jgi:hypothetical protein
MVNKQFIKDGRYLTCNDIAMVQGSMLTLPDISVNGAITKTRLELIDIVDDNYIIAHPIGYPPHVKFTYHINICNLKWLPLPTKLPATRFIYMAPNIDGSGQEQLTEICEIDATINKDGRLSRIAQWQLEEVFKWLEHGEGYRVIIERPSKAFTNYK